MVDSSPASVPPRKKRRLTHLTVTRVFPVTPHMIRVVAGGDALADFPDNGFTDAYVKVLFMKDGVDYPDPLDMEVVRAEYPREHQPAMRTYTVRYQTATELTLDFVVHGDEGIAGPWAAGARVGDDLYLLGPGGAYAPDPAADRHLLVGDESALPAVLRAIEQLPEGTRAEAFIEVGSAEEEQPIEPRTGLTVHWFHRGPDAPGTHLVPAVKAADWPGDDVHAFVHGEAGFVRDLRRYLLSERGMEKDRLSISGYWKSGKNDEGFRADKRAEKQAENQPDERAETKTETGARG
ncbi:siderophore-interacting protein [Spelaeicoccus albus]|uniref:NADPH-dependent ferric siderophore reductase n=1 Tax=Spelaeicoccus albus TaxID=1280376 RepID=A0A7Z0D0W0_9MICO|nr:siderophore-interacting protein [Spelaeicoccus albus]NYI65933.1 NADPH-dependent ferric siderophore reductase [Spelaeicoccus albus]